MKTMLKLALVVVVLTMTNAVFASGNLKVNLVPVSGEKALLAISSVSNNAVQISLTDVDNHIVYYSETSVPENYRKIFDFADLKPGDYKVTVVCNNLTTERKFEKSWKGIKIGEEKTELQPFFSYKDGLLRCTYLNFSNENVKLNIYEKDDLIYSKEMGRKFNVSELLSFSKLGRGAYEAVLNAGDNAYSFTVRK